VQQTPERTPLRRRDRRAPFVAALSGLMGTCLLVAGNIRLGSVPALGPLLSPVVGFWRNMAPLDAVQEVTLAGPVGSVRVVFDRRAVPHIFAKNDRDLFFAQGYVTARDRLFEMDFQTRAAGGRLSEVLGPTALNFDKNKRKRGMVWAAERMLDAVERNPASKEALEAYAQGVNGWVDSLTPAQWPLEYKILGAKPHRWTPLHSALFAKAMAHDLSGKSDDLRLTNDRLFLGDDAMSRLFPHAEVAREPIISKDHVWFLPRTNAPTPPSAHGVPTQLPPPKSPLSLAGLELDPDPGNGSNNWAVGGAKSASGFPLLANDPHLGLRLPSIWYEIQMHAPGVNVYGVSLPGLPNVVAGFNENVAWGVTNGGPDVLDWYKVRFKDETRAEYAFEGQWIPTEKRREIIQVMGEPDTVFDVLYTRQGPVALDLKTKDGNEEWPLAMRWSAHDPNDEFAVFHALDRATDASAAREALAAYGAPVQNFSVITKQGSVGLYHAGRLPLRWREQGRYVLDGSRADHEWHGYIPANENPQEENPSRGFVSSANQHPTDAAYPHWLSGVWNATSTSRGIRVNELLTGADGFTPEAFTRMQGDDLDVVARRVSPWMLARLDAKTIPKEALELIDDFRDWNFRRSATSRVSLFHERWLRVLRESVWKTRIPDESGQPPYLDVFVDLMIAEPDSPWFDDPGTQDKETASTWLNATFLVVWKELSTRLGPYGAAWEWGRARGSDVPHMAKIPGFGVLGLSTAGSSLTINAMQKTHGPSWRFVATFDAEGPRAWSILPGGPSGEPGSPSMTPCLKRGEALPLIR